MRTMSQQQALDRLPDDNMAKRIILHILNSPKVPVDSDHFKYEHLFDRPTNTEEIKSFEVDKPTGKGLELYLKNLAEYEEQNRSNRTYLVRDKNTNELAGYFSLRTGLFTLDRQCTSMRSHKTI